MKKSQTGPSNVKQNSFDNQLKNGRKKALGEHDEWPITIPLTAPIVRHVSIAARAEGSDPIEFMVEAIRLRLLCQAEIATTARNGGKQSQRDMKRDAAALLRLALKNIVFLNRGPAKPSTQPILPAGWQTRGLMDLEEEINAVTGLVELLSQNLAEFQSNCGREIVKSAAAGTLRLSDRTLKRLHEVWEAAWEYYRALPGPDGAAAVSAQAGKGGAI
jgi:hypothetical protein